MQPDTAVSPMGLGDLPRRQIIITFIGVILALFLSSLDQTVVATAMPRIIADLGGFNQYTWVATAYIIASAVIMPITGRLTDLYGRKLFYIAGLILFLVASCACGLSTSMTQLISFRAIQGLAAGVLMSNAFTVMGDLFPPAVRGKYMGFTSAVFGLSSIVGPTLGGFITDTWSWHWVFFVNVPFGIVVILLFSFFFPHLRPDKRRHAIDYPGIVTLILSLVALMLVLNIGGGKLTWTSWQIIGLAIFAIAMLAIFIRIETRSHEPILPLVLFTNPIVAICEVLMLLIGFGMFSVMIFVPLFFQGVLGMTATASGSFLTPMMLGVVVGSMISGQFLARTGGHYKIQGIIGLGLMCTGFAMLASMNINTRYAVAVVKIIVTGFGLGLTMPLYTIAVQNSVPYPLLGVATSTTTFFRSLGGALGLAILGTVMNRRFEAVMTGNIPEAIKKLVPTEQLSTLVHNPQALLNPHLQSRLTALFEQLGPQGQHLYELFFESLRRSLSAGLSRAFWVGLYIIATAFILNLFLREVPLRKQHMRVEAKP